MDINEIIDELQTEFYKSKNFLWSKKSLVNMDRCAELIDELKKSMPVQMQEASYMLLQKDKIIASAEEVARRTIAEAEKHAEQIVCESTLVKKAEEESQQVIDKTNKQCNAMIAVTKENIDKMLKSVEDYLTDNLHIVRNNREEIAGSLINRKKL
ncbi:MAG: hypothetical protein RR334_00320 [Clostridia bacterium]